MHRETYPHEGGWSTNTRWSDALIDIFFTDFTFETSTLPLVVCVYVRPFLFLRWEYIKIQEHFYLSMRCALRGKKTTEIMHTNTQKLTITLNFDEKAEAAATIAFQ